MISFLILIFTYLPNILIHGILVLGIIGFIVSYFLSFSVIGIVDSLQKTVVKYISLFVIVLALYLEGGLAVTNEYNKKQAEWQDKINIAEKKAQDTNATIKTVYVTKIKKIQVAQSNIQHNIDNAALDINKTCKITPVTINILNDAAKNVSKDNK